MEKLPRRKKPDHISLINYKAEFGIPHARTVNILMKNMILKAVQVLALQQHLQHSAASRRLIQDFLLCSTFNHGPDSIHLSCKSNLIVGSTEALSAFTDAAGVAETKGSLIDDIFPIAPTVDLDRSHMYDSRRGTGLDSAVFDFKPHTLLLAMDPEWSMPQRHASALMTSYGHCLEMAKSGGLSAATREVAHPVSVQTIHTDGQTFGFTGFQLNTHETDFKKEIIRNQAWVHSDSLYNKQVPHRASLRNTKYHSYNPAVIRNVLAMLYRQ